MAGKFNLDKPNPLWKHYSKKYVDNDSVKMILSLHRIEKQLRHEILVEQVTLMPGGLLDRKLKAEKK